MPASKASGSRSSTTGKSSAPSASTSKGQASASAKNAKRPAAGSAKGATANSNSSKNNNSKGKSSNDDAENGGKKRRIWAACENCRVRKSKCDGRQPCSVCLHRARNMLIQHASHALRTEQQQNPHKFAGSDAAALTPPEPSELAIYEKASTMCFIDWDRKPRGPKSKAEKALAAATAGGHDAMSHPAGPAGHPAFQMPGMMPAPAQADYMAGVPMGFHGQSPSASAPTYKKSVRTSSRVPGETAYERQQQEIRQAHRERERQFQLQHHQQLQQNHGQQYAQPGEAYPYHAEQHPNQLPPLPHPSQYGPGQRMPGYPDQAGKSMPGPTPSPSYSSHLPPPPPPLPMPSSTTPGGDPAMNSQYPPVGGPVSASAASAISALSPTAPYRPRSSTYGSHLAFDPTAGPVGYNPAADPSGPPPSAPDSSKTRNGWDRERERERERAEWEWEREREARERERDWEARREWAGSAGSLAPAPPVTERSGSWDQRERKRSAAGGDLQALAYSHKRESRDWDRPAPTPTRAEWERERERYEAMAPPGLASAGMGGYSGGMEPPLHSSKLSPRSASISSAAGGPMSAPPISAGPSRSGSTSNSRPYSLFGSHLLQQQGSSTGGSGGGGTSRPTLVTSSSSSSVLTSMAGNASSPTASSINFVTPFSHSHGSSEGNGAVVATPATHTGTTPRASEAGLEAGIASGDSYSMAPTSGADASSRNAPTTSAPNSAGTLLVQICTGSLLTALRDIYTEKDRRYISIAIAHYDVFDNSTKMFPSRILFGERILPPGGGGVAPNASSSTARMGARSSISQVPYVAPAHLQVALLSVLAHRALLTPDGLSLRDLDPSVAAKAGLPPITLPAPSSRPTGAVSSLTGSGSTPTSASSPSTRSSFAGGSGSSAASSGNGAYQFSWLDAHDRHGLLEFARRSLKYAHDVFMSKIENGEVEPSLIITGWLLDMSASEDGVGTRTMANMKATLFGILRKWNLHVMDSDPRDMSVVGPSHSLDEHFAHLAALRLSGIDVAAKGLADRARAFDARQLVKCPVECESLRRVVRIICASYLWTHALDNPPPEFEFNKIQIRRTEYDDFIHQNSAWLMPEEHSSVAAKSVTTLSKLHDLWALYARLVYMMNTPLVDLLSGVGPEKDLQEAVTNMELTLQDIKHSMPPLRFDEEEQPLRIHLYLDTRMIELLLYRHLFPLYAYTKNAGISFNESYVSASSVFPTSSAPSNYERFMGEQPFSYSVDNPYVYPAEGQGGSNGNGNGNHSGQRSRDSNGSVGLRFIKDPQRACFAPLFDIGRLIQAALVKLPRDRTLPALPGSEAGAVLPTAVRMLRWPRHLLLFAQHAFTLAAEVAVAGMAWDRLTGSGDDDPQWVSSPSMEGIPRSNSPQLVTSVWNIGCAIVDLMFAMAHAGSKHASEMAAKAETFKDQRAAIMVGQGWCFRPRRGVAWSFAAKGTAPPRFEPGDGSGAADDDYDPDDEEVILSPGMGKWFEPGMQ